MISKQATRWSAFLLLVMLCAFPHQAVYSFGFFAHRTINRMAVFILPPEMIGFFRKHVEYLSEHSVDPDKRAHAVAGEAIRHYIDIDHYGAHPFDSMPVRWQDAVDKYTLDSLEEHGLLPWHVNLVLGRLTRAFQENDVDLILYHAAHLGHYIADACTPLHTTLHYNGKTPSQRGIHALWESRLPELLAHESHYLVGRAQYVEAPLARVWELIQTSHYKTDSIMEAFDTVREQHPADRMFSYHVRGQSMTRGFSREFALAFDRQMDHMVERQMRLAIKTTGDFWYTAWVNAGQPDLYQLEKRALSRKHRRQMKQQQKAWQQVKVPAGRPDPPQ
ncbi:MAG: zinc dependent phospholipase C family protein [Bacteroidales bacterium]